jgi:hypothetical protein
MSYRVIVGRILRGVSQSGENLKTWEISFQNIQESVKLLSNTAKKDGI